MPAMTMPSVRGGASGAGHARYSAMVTITALRAAATGCSGGNVTSGVSVADGVAVGGPSIGAGVGLRVARNMSQAAMAPFA